MLLMPEYGSSVPPSQLLHLPETAQGAVRDVSDAFRLLLLHFSQWAGTVVRGGEDEFYIDTQLGFGLAPATGVWGVVADAIADILRALGIGPVLKWVDDFLFLTVPLHSLQETNLTRQRLAQSITGHASRGGVAYYTDKSGEEHPEDYAFPVTNQCASCPHDLVSSLATIDAACGPLNVPWKKSKDVDFSPTPIYIGFRWYVSERCVGLPDAKRQRYIVALEQWMRQRRHSLKEVQQLHGKLQHASFVVVQGRKRLGYLRRFLASFLVSRRWSRRHAGKHVNKEVLWWHRALSNPNLRRSFADDNTVHDIVVSCDASTSFGIGVRVDDAELSLPFLPSWCQGGHDIAWLEAVALEIALQAVVAQGVSDCRVRIFADNQSVLFAERSGHSRNASVMAVLARVRDLEADHNIELVPQYVPSKENPADGASRGVRTSFAQLRCPELHDAVRPFFRY